MIHYLFGELLYALWAYVAFALLLAVLWCLFQKRVWIVQMGKRDRRGRLRAARVIHVRAWTRTRVHKIVDRRQEHGEMVLSVALLMDDSELKFYEIDPEWDEQNTPSNN